MAIIDGQGATFSFNGAIVGKITEYNTIDGVVADIKHSPLGGEVEYFPGRPEFGSLNLKMYRDFSDAGQIEMETARAASQRAACVWTLSDGSTRSFTGYVKKLPIVGNDNGLGTADAVIKVAGAITLA